MNPTPPQAKSERRIPVKPLNMKADAVNSPQHYTAGNIETIDYIEDNLSKEGYEGYLVGNILKYMSRYRHKNGLEDLKKAQWYQERLVAFKAKNDFFD